MERALLERALWFYQMSPDGQYDEVAVWAIQKALDELKDKETD